jgi:isopenicillin N synthase-like dioxygenase
LTTTVGGAPGAPATDARTTTARLLPSKVASASSCTGPHLLASAASAARSIEAISGIGAWCHGRAGAPRDDRVLAITEVPEIDVSALLSAGAPGDEVAATARRIDRACREVGAFSITGHGVDLRLQDDLDRLAREFFALPDVEKAEVAMARAGRAWRGWFPLGGELTAGVPDMKEGLYFGAELDGSHPRVREGTPLHGANLFPRRPAALKSAVLTWVDELTRVGQAVLGGMALGLGLDAGFFVRHLTGDPLVLFRIFRYPPADGAAERWGVGEHTDYGLLTLLAQDGNAGLQLRTEHGWVDVDPRRGRFFCNLGDMLERLTGGCYRSTPHRVQNAGVADRLSLPFFLDPSWDAVVDRLPIVERPVDDRSAAERWDHTSVHGFAGTYGEYVLAKVGKVFPDLAARADVAESRPTS